MQPKSTDNRNKSDDSTLVVKTQAESALIVNSTIRTLLVKDSEDDAELIILRLRRDGHKFISKRVDSLDQLQDALDKQDWDIVISDYKLLGYTGLDVLQIMKERELDIPCIIVSGQISDETAVEAMKAGAIDYVMKDNLVRLLPAIQRALDETQKKGELKEAQEKLNKYYAELEQKVKDRTTELTDINRRLKAEIKERKKVEIKNLKLVQELRIHQTELEAQAEDLRQTQLALQQSRDRYLGLYDFAPVGYLTLDKYNLIVEANLTACTLLGVNREYLTQCRFTQFIKPTSQEVFYFNTRQLWRDKAGAKVSFEVEIVKAGGALFDARLEGVRSGDTLHLAIVDISDLKEAEEALSKAKDELEIKVRERTTELSQMNEQLKQYATRITSVQEAERKRIAYELHDDTAQYLALVKMELGALLQSGEIQNPKILEKLQYLEKDSDRAFNDVRRYSHELRPSVLEHMGLRASLEQTADDINKLNQFKLEVEVEGKEPKLSEEVKLGFFRIAQEALNNIRKHAKASRVTISLKFEKKHMNMKVSDNGIGFDIDQSSTKAIKKGSLGLMSMKERADLIGASLKIESLTGSGTTVSVEKSL